MLNPQGFTFMPWNISEIVVKVTKHPALQMEE